MSGASRLQAVVAAFALLAIVGTGFVLARTSAGGAAHPTTAADTVPPGADAVPARSPAGSSILGGTAGGPPAAAAFDTAAPSGSGTPSREPGLVPPATPDQPCPTSRDGRPPLAILGADGMWVAGHRALEGRGSPGTDDPIDPPPHLTIPVASPVELDLVDGHCAVAWTIGLAGIGTVGEAADAGADPPLVAHDRITFVLPALGRSAELRAALTFPDGIATYSWIVDLAGIPSLAASVSASSRTIAAVEGCGADVSTDWNGPAVRSSEPIDCPDELPSSTPETLAVEAGEALTFETAGWRVASLTARCEPVPSGPLPSGPLPAAGPFTDACPLAVIPRTSSRFTIAAPSVRGTWTVRVAATLQGDGLVWAGTFFFDVDVR